MSDPSEYYFIEDQLLDVLRALENFPDDAELLAEKAEFEARLAALELQL